MAQLHWPLDNFSSMGKCLLCFTKYTANFLVSFYESELSSEVNSKKVSNFCPLQQACNERKIASNIQLRSHFLTLSDKMSPLKSFNLSSMFSKFYNYFSIFVIEFQSLDYLFLLMRIRTVFTEFYHPWPNRWIRNSCWLSLTWIGMNFFMRTTLTPSLLVKPTWRRLLPISFSLFWL